MNQWPLRTKLTTWSALVSGIALLVCGVVAVLFVQHEQIEALDDQLRNEAHTFFGEFLRWKNPINWDARGEARAVLPLTRTHRFIEIVNADGQTLYRTKQPRSGSLPRRTPGSYTIEINGRSARLGVYRERGMTLLLATSLSEIRADTTRMMLGFAASFPFLVAIVALGAWSVARKALGPVDVITNAARQITAERLDERLPSRAVHDEIGRLTEVLNDMFDRLDTSFRQAARFSADASHELKTPLTVLRAGVENLLASKELSPADQASVAVLLEQTHRLTSITESLLLLARADGGRLKLDYATACVSELISACMDDAQIMAEPRGIQISAVVPPALPATVDSKRVSQIVLNLLDNAVKHNVDGGRVAVEAKRVGVIIVVTVGNSGPGISPADCRKLFQRFFRAKSNTETDGAGLGLSIARELARAHFGDLELVQSRDGWTTFQFRLLAPVPASEHGNGRLPSEALV